jgi:hypothetical protein
VRGRRCTAAVRVATVRVHRRRQRKWVT